MLGIAARPFAVARPEPDIGARVVSRLGGRGRTNYGGGKSRDEQFSRHCFSPQFPAQLLAGAQIKPAHVNRRSQIHRPSPLRPGHALADRGSVGRRARGQSGLHSVDNSNGVPLTTSETPPWPAKFNRWEVY